MFVFQVSVRLRRRFHHRHGTDEAPRGPLMRSRHSEADRLHTSAHRARLQVRLRRDA